MSKIFWRTIIQDKNVLQGWCYKYKNEISKVHDTKRDAEHALMLRIMGTKPQRGHSTIKTA